MPSIIGLQMLIPPDSTEFQQLRHHWNRRNGVPWDTPILSNEFQAIREWEKKWDIQFIAGENMVVWDGDKINDRVYVSILHGPTSFLVSTSSSSTESDPDD